MLHQNMRRFNGADGDRNAAYRRAFGNIAQTLQRQQVAVEVAGFTEVFSGDGAGFTGNPGIASVLGLTHRASICCGGYAQGRRFVPEYVAISTANAPIGYGRVSLQVGGRGADVLVEYSADASDRIWSRPNPDATADYRAAVFVTVGYGRDSLVVGFVHNRYGDGAGAGRGHELAINWRSKVPQMLSWMRHYGAAPGDAAVEAPAIIGGDYNLAPRDFGRRDNAWPHWSSMANEPRLPANPGRVRYPAFAANGTLWSGNVYDYWYSNINPQAPPNGYGAPQAEVDSSTLDCAGNFTNYMSDHCAIRLSV